MTWRILLVGLMLGPTALADESQRTPREALQAFNDQIGVWRGTGTPAGSREEQQKGFWVETMTWEWQFQGKGKKDAWIKIDIDKGKHYTGGELRFVPAKDHFTLTLKTPAKDSKAFTGTLENKVLTMERQAGEQMERLVFTFLHGNRFLYRQEVRPATRGLFTKLYTVGVTREGVPFASDSKPECIVSGGLGTMAVTFQGHTFYVCCGGCRTEFNENAAKYVKEFQEKKKKAK